MYDPIKRPDITRYNVLFELYWARKFDESYMENWPSGEHSSWQITDVDWLISPTSSSLLLEINFRTNIGVVSQVSMGTQHFCFLRHKFQSLLHKIDLLGCCAAFFFVVWLLLSSTWSRLGDRVILFRFLGFHYWKKEKLNHLFPGASDAQHIWPKGDKNFLNEVEI